LYPKVVLDLSKIEENARRVSERCLNKGITVVGVTKVTTGDPKIATSMLQGGIEILGDSRVRNLARLEPLDVPLMLLRIPMLSEISRVVRHSDISLNTELQVLKALAKEARRQSKNHHVVLMIDVGDRREGIMPDELLPLIMEARKLESLTITGLGTNVGCFGGVLPTEKNTELLVELADRAEKKLGLHLTTLSGGSTVTLTLLEDKSLPAGINQLRIGEGIILGTDVTSNRAISWLGQDTVEIVGEVVELKRKPSQPSGPRGRDAFGRKRGFRDRGDTLRAILAMGKQDIEPSGLTPLEKGIEVLGASSDHTVLEVEENVSLEVGDTVRFRPDYKTLLRTMTSEYVDKEYFP